MSKNATNGRNETTSSLPFGLRPLVDAPKLSNATKRRYIGVLTKTEADKYVQYETGFRLYHQWNPVQTFKMGDRLPLAVLYRSSRGDSSHWMIRTTGTLTTSKTSGKKQYVISNYYIETLGPAFKNLADLVGDEKESFSNVFVVSGRMLREHGGLCGR
ncbi:hypothetical protein M3Y95_01001500 [Aphelenchoides besseyi]|nr:hypothetical protein M3Y95_01001500 [Aphelenchoides besseyi]